VEFSLLGHPPCSDQLIPRYILPFVPLAVSIGCTVKLTKRIGDCNLDSYVGPVQQ